MESKLGQPVNYEKPVSWKRVSRRRSMPRPTATLAEMYGSFWQRGAVAAHVKKRAWDPMRDLTAVNPLRDSASTLVASNTLLR